ncbi:dihydrouridine synthase-domain-containing protein [Sphaerosporella brunnea]|uniref:tRNA-dihydrouridine(16/17) synthase [NAD(P)(+)] n=1 Tax=Sphaerosporella brunnea TaxID=1250544 RepID=A0A5J5EGX9_9PEZI|nr:dihydrouridine synthase-domain-containing protein [Sphaerosporella brunnea]
MASDAAAVPQNASITSEPASKRRKLQGREFYEAIGSPRTVVAPMVEQSELAWRLLSRRHSPENTLCYTPMFHSRLFATTSVYRQQSFQPPHLDGAPADRPVFVQFCSNDPEDLLGAAKEVEAHCDAVDLNLGCPQGIARKGHYGAFLQEDWGLIHSLIRRLHDNLSIPVTAKIRILETKERSLEYAKMVVDAGAQVLTVHGRTRDQKGHNTGLADWGYIKYIRDHLPKGVVMFANGNILWHEDVERCLAATGVDGVMSAEGNLYNPAIFETSKDWDKRFPRMDKIGREYLDIIRHEILPHLPLKELLEQEPSKRSRKKLNEVFKDANLTAIKSHLFKLWHSLLPRHKEVRNMVGQASTRHMGPGGDPLREYEECQKRVEQIIAEELERNPEEVDADGKWVGPDREITDADESQETEGFVVEIDGNKFRRIVPWYRCQPYFRPLPEKALAIGAMTAKGEKTVEGGKRKAVESSDVAEAEVKKVKVQEAEKA